MTSDDVSVAMTSDNL